MKKNLFFFALAFLLISNLSVNAMDDLIASPPAVKKKFFMAAPKNHKEAEEFIFPILKPSKKIRKAAKAFFNLAFRPENSKLTAFLTVHVWNNYIDLLFGKNTADQQHQLQVQTWQLSQWLNRKRRAEY